MLFVLGLVAIVVIYVGVAYGLLYLMLAAREDCKVYHYVNRLRPFFYITTVATVSILCLSAGIGWLYIDYIVSCEMTSLWYLLTLLSLLFVHSILNIAWNTYDICFLILISNIWAFFISGLVITVSVLIREAIILLMYMKELYGCGN